MPFKPQSRSFDADKSHRQSRRPGLAHGSGPGAQKSRPKPSPLFRELEGPPRQPYNARIRRLASAGPRSSRSPPRDYPRGSVFLLQIQCCSQPQKAASASIFRIYDMNGRSSTKIYDHNGLNSSFVQIPPTKEAFCTETAHDNVAKKLIPDPRRPLCAPPPCFKPSVSCSSSWPRPGRTPPSSTSPPTSPPSRPASTPQPTGTQSS